MTLLSHADQVHAARATVAAQQRSLLTALGYLRTALEKSRENPCEEDLRALRDIHSQVMSAVSQYRARLPQ